MSQPAPPPQPHEIDALARGAYAAFRAGDYPRAASMSEMVTRADPSRTDAWVMLCTSLTRMGSNDEERAIADALKHIPHADAARLMLESSRANALAKHGRWAEALEVLERIENDPDLKARQRDVVGAVFSKISLFERGLAHAAKAAAALPDDPATNYNYATSLRYMGRLDEAETAFERVIALNPNDSMAHSSLASLKKWKPERNHVARMRATLAATPADTDAKARMHYALFKELDDIGERQEAWAALSAGAALTNKLYPYRKQEKEAYVEALIKSYPKERIDQPFGHTPSGPRPIFVFGLPRSGTTLVERILASHSRVTPLGETVAFPRAMRQALGLSRKNEMNPSEISKSASVDWSVVAETYQRETAHLAHGADIVTEKLPHNYDLVGQMSLAFPNAALVHVRRAPMDTLFGAYKIMFGEDSYAWSYRFEDLAHNYRLYRGITDHWRSVLGSRFVEITLEELISDSENQIRRLIAACGLNFEEACLSPHETEGGVSTASSSQVRSPINRQGVGAWRRYEQEFEPLRAEIERDGFVDSTGEPIWRS